MIDGIKIDVNNLNGSKWLSNKLLHFHTYTSVDTGELLDGTLVAKHKGLKFFIIQSTKYENKVYYSVRGSLHKYFNKGRHNANDFTFKDLQKVLKELEQKFNINLANAILRNIEFGVNIYAPIKATELLKNLVCYGRYTFGILKIESITLGKVVKKQQSNLKIYDKGLQYNLSDTNLIRFEIAVKKMLFLKKYNIVTLADLQDISKTKPLEDVLLSYWNDVVYYDKIIDWKRLTEFERKKILYYATPRNWSDFEIKQRYRAKKHFKELMLQFSTSTTHKEIFDLIALKWQQLSVNICPQINHDLEPKNEKANVHKLTVSIDGYNVDKSTPKKESSKTPKKPPQKKANLKRKKCKVCTSDLSHKKASSKFCTKKCNNHFHGKIRTKKRQSRIMQEKENLEKLLKILPKNKIWLMVSYKTSSGIYTDTLKQNEIHTSKDWIKKVQKILVTEYRKKAKPIILTSYRARKLLSEINKQNET